MTNVNGRFNDAYQASNLTITDLWLRYFALGGEAGELEIDAYVHGATTLPALQHDMLTHAINERLDEIAPARAPYSEDCTPDGYLAGRLRDR